MAANYRIQWPRFIGFSGLHIFGIGGRIHRNTQIAHIRKTQLPEEHVEQLTQMCNEQYEQLVLSIAA